jgi:hypothetical protein
LLDSEVLDIVNHTIITAVFDNAMKLLWEGEVKSDSILIFVTDAAPYIVKAAKGLQLLYQRDGSLALQRVAEEIRDDDKLIPNVMKMFVKAPLRMQKFKQDAPSLSPPPQPVLTCWACGWKPQYITGKTTLQLRTLSVILTAMKHLP